MDTFRPTINVMLRGAARKTIAGQGTTGFRLAYAKQLSPDCDELYTFTRTLAAGASETLDLSGALVNPLGETVALARVRALVVELTAATAATGITVGPLSEASAFAAMFNGPADGVRIQNGGVFLLATPAATAYPVAAGTGDDIKVTNNDGAVAATYSVTILGGTT